MAILSKSERTAGTGQGGGKVNRTAKWFLMVSILGAALVLAFVAAVATQGGSSITSGADTPAAVPANVPTGGQYRLSPPNELDPDDSPAISVGDSPAVYRVSPPNEADPTSYPPYRVSPPNEQNPSSD